MAAKYYIYRNLHTGGFSIKYRGIVIERTNQVAAYNVTFKVNELGRQQVIREKSKNVHAYVVCDKYDTNVNECVDKLSIVTYNPYKHTNFVSDDKYIFNANSVYCKNGKCYLK